MKMPSSAKKMPVKTEDASSKRAALATPWHPLANLREQIDHLFEDFSRSPLPMPFGRRMFDVEPFFRRELMGRGIPAVDIAEKEKRSEEHTSELQSQSNLVCRLLLEKNNHNT